MESTDVPGLREEVAGAGDPTGAREAHGADDADGAVGADEVDGALLDAIEAELADVELALGRLGDGTYGRCESCGRTLTEAELEEAPTGRFCRDHLPLGPT